MRMFMKKNVILSIFILGVLLSGCCNDPQIDTTEIQQENEAITIEIMAPSGELFDIDRQLMRDYEKFSGNKIEFQEIPDDQYTNVLKAKLASGQGPDIAVIWPRTNASQFFPERFVDLSNQSWVKEETEEAIDNQSFNGHIIGFGTEGGNSGWGILYNKRIFESCGISIPNNTEEFMENCKILLENGYTPLAGAFKEEWTLGIWLALMGSKAALEIEDYYELLNANKIGFSDSEVYRQFIIDYKEMYDQGYLGPTVFNSTARDAFLQVFEGTAAMALSNCSPTTWLADSKLSVSEEEYGMFPAPFADNRYISPYKGGFIRVINKKSTCIDACIDYFDFLSQRENLQLYYETPERRAVNPAFSEFAEKFEKNKFEKELLDNSIGSSEIIGETGILYWDNTTFGHYILQAVIGSITPDEALLCIDEYRSKMFEVEE